MTLTRALFKLARLSATGHAVHRSVQTGSLRPLERREANRLKGRLLGKAGVWRWQLEVVAYSL